MSFTSYKPFKKKNLGTKYFLIFIFGMFSVLFFTNAFTIVTNLDNATQYIKEIILTDDGSSKGTTGVAIDGNTSGGRVGSNLYCTTDFSKCINVKSIVSTGDLGGLGIIKTGDLATFKGTEIDPVIINLSGKIITISGALNLLSSKLDILSGSLSSDYAKLTDLDGLANKSSLDTLSGTLHGLSITDLLIKDVSGGRTCTAGDIAFVAGRYQGCAIDGSRTGLSKLVD